ncbi:hypothetical protein V5E97_12555 [Singulisphaera sp. Ch08]|uniref:Uncharacterized protein n=1 Tax=Singulisphaera sp. Ch08 TaxID=3120278 RepID=A0AAU7CMZ5_9BACT
MQRQTLLTVFLGLGLVGGIAFMAQRLGATAVEGAEAPPSPPSAVVAPLPVVVPPPLPLPDETQPPSVPLPLTETLLGVDETQNLPPLAGASATKPRQAGDPMDDLKTFHQQSRQKAEAQIKSLTQEVETLRARLQKVEVALEGWKSISTALEQEQERSPGVVLSVRRGFRKHVEEAPTHLEPVPVESVPESAGSKQP